MRYFQLSWYVRHGILEEEYYFCGRDAKYQVEVDEDIFYTRHYSQSTRIMMEDGRQTRVLLDADPVNDIEC